ncbi:group II intron maturase-specific domain-containing protein [Xanthobacter sp. DSM 24535]|uniref:group II intron maturase-specific domain-containing protein n=1 Tax=Roseixanthobacter psychrophilus TaxID=3119917 RepID=UPI00372AA8E0
MQPREALPTCSRSSIPILRGWANYYCYCVGASRVFSNLDWYTSDRIRRWLHKKRPNSGARAIWAAYQPSARRPMLAASAKVVLSSSASA